MTNDRWYFTKLALCDRLTGKMTAWTSRWCMSRFCGHLTPTPAKETGAEALHHRLTRDQAGAIQHKAVPWQSWLTMRAHPTRHPKPINGWKSLLWAWIKKMVQLLVLERDDCCNQKDGNTLLIEGSLQSKKHSICYTSCDNRLPFPGEPKQGHT